MATSYYDVQRDTVLKQLRASEEKKLEALATIAEIGASGALALGVAQEVAALLDDPSDDVQMAAMDTLGSLAEIGAEYADKIKKYLSSKDDRKRAYALGALGMMETHAARYAVNVVDHLADEAFTVRAAACLALGGMQADKYVESLAKLLDDKSSEVVLAAMIALSMFDEQKSKPYAGNVAKRLNDINKEVRVAALQYFAKFANTAPQHADAICKLLTDEDTTVRQTVAELFAAMAENSEKAATGMVAAAAKVLSHQDARFKAAAATAIASAGASALQSQVDVLNGLLDDTTEDQSQLINAVAGIEVKAPSTVRIPACAAMSAFASMGDEACLPKIVKLLQSNNTSVDVRIMAAQTIGQIGAKGEAGRAAEDDCRNSLMDALQARQAPLRAQATRSLGLIATQRSNPKAWLASQPKVVEEIADKVAECLVDKSPLVRAAAAEALGNMGDEGAAFTEALLELLKDRSAAVRASAARAFAGVGVKGQLFATELVRKMYEDGADVKIACVQALADMGARGAAFADEVATLINDQDVGVRVAALEALAKMGQDARPIFLSAAEQARDDKLQEVREVAEKLLSIAP